MKIDFEKLKKDSKKLTIKSSDQYIQTYPEFLSYFANLKNITRHNLVISTHFVYGWMPTILKKLRIQNEKEVLGILNRVKKGENIDKRDLEVLKYSINNSLVGVSKLLHFICPVKYAIWDSRVYRYIYGKNSQHNIEKPELYLEYLKVLSEIVKDPRFSDIQAQVEKACGYSMTQIRVAELIMYEHERK